MKNRVIMILSIATLMVAMSECDMVKDLVLDCKSMM